MKIGRPELRQAIVAGLTSHFHGTTDGSVGRPAEGVSDRYPVMTNPAIAEDAADRVLAVLDESVRSGS